MQRARGKRGTGVSCRMSFVRERGGGKVGRGHVKDDFLGTGYFSILQKHKNKNKKLYTALLIVSNSLQ
jgi:hypothetical protein